MNIETNPLITDESVKYWAGNPQFGCFPSEADVREEISRQWRQTPLAWQEVATKVAGGAALRQIVVIDDLTIVDQLLAGVRIAAPSLKGVTAFNLWALTDTSIPRGIRQVFGESILGSDLNKSNATIEVHETYRKSVLVIRAHFGTTLLASRVEKGVLRLTIDFGLHGSVNRANRIMNIALRGKLPQISELWWAGGDEDEDEDE